MLDALFEHVKDELAMNGEEGKRRCFESLPRHLLLTAFALLPLLSRMLMPDTFRADPCSKSTRSTLFLVYPESVTKY
jgi:hypothetical protein